MHRAEKWPFILRGVLCVDLRSEKAWKSGGLIQAHTPYRWNIMCQKSEGDCGLWDLTEIIIKKHAESLKKIVGAVWELPAK